MTERIKRPYDAARAKSAILAAAEQLFAEHGYSAARIDAIASASGYNKSLIYQYYQDKLGLYVAVIQRADQFGNEAFNAAVAEMLADAELTHSPDKFRRFLEAVLRTSYRIMNDNPNYVKIFAWEAAEGWKTWKQISYAMDEFTPFYELACEAKKNKIIRQDIEPIMIPILLMNSIIPFVQSFKRLDGPTNDSLDVGMNQEAFVEQLVKLVIYGVMEPSLL
ncbi:TetR/AcrR family transcriptional regulator [Paenibacillus methanolicus]|uniref:AcrR family transcriptional regulator n=1 Tax=Paenibacillus methanolicus TaxID=582686 RepID=A0A5S5C4R3_9BACL|nr:TetR/AcrR family transcriptional regulator [Paenibacillus methanolicus]TYP73320.1 AcrR family transcriptional regulator [Paenibacillus methanolicus]